MKLAAIDNTMNAQTTDLIRGLQPESSPFAQAMSSRNKLRQAAEQFVATSLIGPLMSELQKDPFRSELFHGGFGEKVFNQQLTTMLADRIAQRTSLPIVESIYQQFAGEAHGLNPWASAGGKVDVNG